MLARRYLLAGVGAPTAGKVLDPLLRTQRAPAVRHDIKMTAVEPYALKGGKCWVIVRTFDGFSGIGEVSPMNANAAALPIRDTFAPLLVGINPLDIDRCRDGVIYRTYKQGVMGLQPEALAGFEIALWDILGKVAGMPIHRLLGGKRRDTVRVYASIGGAGREHNPYAFTSWLAGWGIKGGTSYGTSDEWSYKAAENPTYCYDLHATVLHLLGIDHTQLTYRNNGIDRRLTDVHGHVIGDIILRSSSNKPKHAPDRINVQYCGSLARRCHRIRGANEC